MPESEINAEYTSPSYSSYRPYRGRGFRARGFPRGSPSRGGGVPRSSMKLDNRPRKLLIQGVPANDEAVQLIRNHYQVCCILISSKGVTSLTLFLILEHG